MTFKLFSRVTEAFEELCMGKASPDSSLPVVLSDVLTQSGGVLTAPVLNINLLTNGASDWYDAGQFHSATFQIQTGGVSAGVLTFEQTNDITRSPAGNLLQVFDMTTQNANPVTSLTLAANATRLFGAAITARYVRVRVSTAVVGGNVSCSGVFSQQPFSNTTLNMQQATAFNLQTTAVIAPGANLVGDVGNQARATTGGIVAPFRLLSSAATTNATLIKASAGRLFLIIGRNNVASIRYLKFYNKASAPTVGTDVPVLTIALDASSRFEIDLNPYGQFFTTGIAFAITGALADNDTTAIAAADILALNAWFA
mgnify:CR=1 FL=1